MTRKPASRRVVWVAHYSGHQSRAFWRAINSLKPPRKWFVYNLGVALQEAESEALKELNSGESPNRKPRGERR